jgi:signal transduction histidine kinase
MANRFSSLQRSQLQQIVSTMVYAAEADTSEQVLRRIAQASCELIGARYGAVGVPGGQDEGLTFFEVSGMTDEEISRIDHPPVGKGLLGAIIHEQQPVRVDDIAKDPRSVGFPKGHPPMTTFLGVPIQVGSQLLGILYLTDKEDGQPFDPFDQWLAETMARYAALAIAGSQLREQQRRLTLLEERQRIGMELHDGVIQSLYALGMRLDLGLSTGEITPTDLKTVIDGLNKVIEDIRAYIMDLKPIAGARTVRQSVSDIVARLYVPETLTVNVDAPNKLPPFAPADFESICSIAREALSNAMRHAQADEVGIRVWQDSHNFQMMIWDDGQGFDPTDLSKDAGLGLRNIKERVRLHQGTLSIESRPGQGTTIRVTIPANGRDKWRDDPE